MCMYKYIHMKNRIQAYKVCTVPQAQIKYTNPEIKKKEIGKKTSSSKMKMVLEVLDIV